MVGLVGVSHIGTVVQVVLMTVLIDVLVVVALISDPVIVYISLREKKVEVLMLSVHECITTCTGVPYLIGVV